MKSGVFHSIFCFLFLATSALAQAQESNSQPLVEPAVEETAKPATPEVTAPQVEGQQVVAPVEESNLVNDLEEDNSSETDDSADVIPATPEEISQGGEPKTEPDKPKVLAKPKKVKSIWNGALIWSSFGLGSPGNSLNFPSTHMELGLDLQYFDRIKAGPYYSKTSGNRSEYFYFSNTGYEETRYYNVTSQVIGVQARGQAYDTYHGRLAVGLSQTVFKVTDVESNAPITSSALGYKKTYPLGIAFEAALQKNWSWLDWGVGVEWGFNMTSVFASETFTEKYVAVVGRYFFGRAKSAKKLLTPKKASPTSSTPPPAQ